MAEPAAAVHETRRDDSMRASSFISRLNSSQNLWEQLLIQELLLQRREHPSFDFVMANGQVSQRP
jgi:hypothetical protein